MSIESWKKEFYKIPADETTKAKALEHSLNKWSGLTKESLKKHRVLPTSLFPEGVDSASCALCFHYYDTTLEGSCSECPLAKSRDGIACDERNGTEKDSPYYRYRDIDDPLPMIRALKKAQKYVQIQAAKKKSK